MNAQYTLQYYAIREANRVDRDTVNQIMKTTGYNFYAPGIYQYGVQPAPNFLRLSLISQWEYDMLDAFGVEVISLGEFRNMDSLYLCQT